MSGRAIIARCPRTVGFRPPAEGVKTVSGALIFEYVGEKLKISAARSEILA